VAARSIFIRVYWRVGNARRAIVSRLRSCSCRWSDSYEIVVRRSFADYFCRILLDAGCNVTLHKSPICGSQIGAPARIRCERAILWALPPKRSTPGGTPWNTAS
jgi:hypothetical protein